MRPRAGRAPGSTGSSRGCATCEGATLAFGHGHSLRALAARWLGRRVDAGRFFELDTATVSVLAYERETPVLRHWNS